MNNSKLQLRRSHAFRAASLCLAMLCLTAPGGCGKSTTGNTSAEGTSAEGASVDNAAVAMPGSHVSGVDLQGLGNTVQSEDAPASPVTFVDVTQKAKIRFKQNTGSFGLKWLPEQLGSGVACFDFDGDGWPDIYFPNGRDWTDAELAAYMKGGGKGHDAYVNRVLPKRVKGRHLIGALYRNNHDGTFSDVTRGSGLDIETYGMGVAAGDYDNDGLPDLYVAGYNGNHLFHNLGRGKFRDVTERAGVRDAGLSTLCSSAMWLDYGRDGKLDLFVCHYMKWNPALDYFVGGSLLKGNTSPSHYKKDMCLLFRNKGNGQFEDASIKAGIRAAPGDTSARARSLGGKALGVALCDFDNDVWPDIAVANDRELNFLFRNNHNGTFTNVASKVGVAASSTTGRARSGMGIDAADIDHTNRESLMIGNFSGEMLGLYQNMGNGLFVDIAQTGEVGFASKEFLTFGCLFTDVDLDGWPDMFLANGHVNDLIQMSRADQTYAQRPLLFRNEGASAKRIFREIGLESGAPFFKPVIGRGLAAADFDLDGDQDIVLTAVDSAPELLRNDSKALPEDATSPGTSPSTPGAGEKHHSIRVTLRGTKSNRDAIGAIVWAEAGLSSVRRRVHSGSSYLSQSELPLTLGLGHSTSANIVVRWPSDKLMELGRVQADQSLLIDEDRGIIHRQPLARR